MCFPISFCKTLAFALVLFPLSLMGIHNRAGHISARMTGPLSVEITLTTYSDPSVALVDRCDADIGVWNNTGTALVIDLQDVPRSNGPTMVDSLFGYITCPGGQGMGEYVLGNVKRNVYKTTHTFLTPGTYRLRYYDTARSDNLANMPFSDNQPFFVETVLTIGGGIGDQSTVEFLNLAVDRACTGQTWTFNPGGYDADGDSLVYAFTTPQQFNPPFIPMPIPCTGFLPADTIGNNGPLSIEPASGLVTWDAPQTSGTYAFALLVSEYRNGVLLGETILDQVVTVGNCNNQPPAISAIRDTIVTEGDTLWIPFKVWDPDFPMDSLYFQSNNTGIGLNSAFRVLPAASISMVPATTLPASGTDTLRGTIEWVIGPGLARSAPYQIDLFAHDNISYHGAVGQERLSTHHVIQVKVDILVGRQAPLLYSTDASILGPIYPNPVSVGQTVRLNSPEKADIQIFDGNGRQIWHSRQEANHFEVDTRDFVAGMYLIVASKSNRQVIRKLLIQN